MLGYQWEETIQKSSGLIPVFDETHVFPESERFWLLEENVALESIVVSDPSGGITYSAGFDYAVLQSGVRTEISLVPGGRLVVNDTVRVDYGYASQPTANRDGIISDVGVDLTAFGVVVFFHRSLLDTREPVDPRVSLTFGGYDYMTLGAQYSKPFLQAGRILVRAELRSNETGHVKTNSTLLMGVFTYPVLPRISLQAGGDLMIDRGNFLRTDRSSAYFRATWNVHPRWLVFGQAGYWSWSQEPGGATRQGRFVLGSSYDIGSTSVQARVALNSSVFNEGASSSAESRVVVRLVRRF